MHARYYLLRRCRVSFPSLTHRKQRVFLICFVLFVVTAKLVCSLHFLLLPSEDSFQLAYTVQCLLPTNPGIPGDTTIAVCCMW